MSDLIIDAVKAVGGPLKTLFVDKIQDYLEFIKTYDANIDALVVQLENLHGKKELIDAAVTEGKANLRVMTIETMNWLKRFFNLIKSEDLKTLMKEERVAGNVVKMMEHGVLKKLWKEDREIFDIVVNVVKEKCKREAGGGEAYDATEDADYKKIAKVASDVMKDIAEEFKFLKTDDAAVAVVNMLDAKDLEKLTKGGDEIALLLSKGEGIVRNKIEQNDDHDEEEELLMIPLLRKHGEDVQPASNNVIKEKVRNLRKQMGSLMAFVDDDKFRKGLPDGANLGLQVMDAVLSNNSGSLIDENGKPHRHCDWCVVRFEFYRYRHDMSELAKNMGETIKALIDGYPVGPLTRRKREDELENIPRDFTVGLESREQLVQNILTALKDDQINVVGVFGMGGGGKTTLAKEVANKRVYDLFNKRVVVEVSEVPNIKGIQDQIAEGIGLKLEDTHSVALRAHNLYNSLKSEKILLVLDNVWKKLKLGEVGIPRESTRDFYCKLLITTREKQVCKDMDVKDDNIFEVDMLNEKEALKLFEKQTEKKVGNGEFKLVADRILRKCGGLPLAIVTSGGALRGKKLPMWCHFAETSEKPISSQVSSEYHETYSVLETSFKLIDNEVKWTFFFLACLSPLDSAVAIEDLMRYGIGLDLFQRANGLLEAMKQASAWANELISSSLLLKSDSDREVKIHDVVRASAISFADKGKDGMTLIETIPRWMCEETFEKFMAISLMSGNGNDFSRLSGVNAHMLKILLLKGDISSPTLTPDFFGGMKNLKVLSLSNMNFNLGLPESMGQLHRLKTLHLHHCKLRDVKLIGKLVNLLVLSLRGSSLEELAVEIGELYKLRLLDIEGCKGMKRIPANILSRLSHLEGLYMFNGFDSWASSNFKFEDGREFNQVSGSELDTLSHLNVLEMETDDFRIDQFFTVNKGQLIEQLGKFKIRVSSRNISHEKLPVYRYVLELTNFYRDLSQSSGLRALLKKTECLVLRHCYRLTKNVVPEFDEDGFTDVKYLTVENCDVKFLFISTEQNGSMAFANLEILELIRLDNIEKICDGKASVGIFSNLRRLYLSELPKLKCGLPLTSVLLNLNEVSVHSCKSLKFVAYKDAKTAKDETEVVDVFPYLKSLHLSSVESLSSVVEQSENEVLALFNAESKYSFLESLELKFNQIIETIWSPACYVSGFQNLKALRFGWCRELRSLGSPSIFVALVQLEELEISKCNKLQEVISREIEGDGILERTINFPKLKYLSLEDSMEIERFYRGSYHLKFPNLKSLCLSIIPHFTNFDGLENSTTLFSDKIEFPCLEELEVQNVSTEVLEIWNWSSSRGQGESESGSISLNPVPNLKILRLGNVHGFVSIPHSVSHKLTHFKVNEFGNIKSLFSVSAVNGEAFCTYSQLPTLKNLWVGDCESMEQLFETEDDDVAVSLCERLTVITLYGMPKLKILPLHLLKNIRTLSLVRLSWKYVFSADLFIKGKEQLQLLESLKICLCENMEVIIKDELAGNGEESVYSFPRLKILELESLNITKFSSKPNTIIQFPSLESIELFACDTIQSFWSGFFIAPKLKQVKLDLCENMQCFLSEKRNEVLELPLLERVEIYDCSRLLSFSSEPLVVPKLHQVTLENCPEMKWFLGGDPNNNEIVELLPSLEIVSITDCEGMKSFSSGGMDAPKLSEFVVGAMDYSKCANEELQYLLANLPSYHKRDDDDDDEEEEEEEDDDDEEEEEEGDQSDGEMEELRTEEQGNDKSQEQQQIMEGHEEVEELLTEVNAKSQEEQIKHGMADGDSSLMG